MFRLDIDLLDRLKELAKNEHRSLNNYVECVLLDVAYRKPNAETIDSRHKRGAKRSIARHSTHRHFKRRRNAKVYGNIKTLHPSSQIKKDVKRIKIVIALQLTPQSNFSEYFSAENLQIQKIVVPLHHFPKGKGRLAQLVQSICLTSRGSAVRIRQRPHYQDRSRGLFYYPTFYNPQNK